MKEKEIPRNFYWFSHMSRQYNITPMQYVIPNPSRKYLYFNFTDYLKAQLPNLPHL